MSGYDFAQYLDFIVFFESEREADLITGIYFNEKKINRVKKGGGTYLTKHIFLIRKGWNERGRSLPFVLKKDLERLPIIFFTLSEKNRGAS